MRQSNSHSEPSGLMSFLLNFERITSISGHKTLKKGRDTSFPAQARSSLDSHNKVKGLRCVSRTSHNLLQRSIERGNGGITVHSKMAGQSSRVKDKKDDELVKYMSKLPGYLQRLEKEENLQDKALNVGVLDWTRLEQWKGKQVTASVGEKAQLFGNNLSSKPCLPSSKFPDATRSEEHRSASSNHVASCSGDISQPGKLPVRNVMRFQDIGTSLKNCSVSNEEAILQNEKRRNSNFSVASKVDNQSANWINYSALVTPKQSTGASGDELRGSVEEIQLIRREARDQKINSSMRSASSKLRKHVASLNSKEVKSNVSPETKKRVEGLQEASVSLETNNRTEGLQESLVSLATKNRTEGLQESSALSQEPEPQAVEKRNIVLLVPKKYAKNRESNGQKTPVVQNYIKTENHRLSRCVSHDDDHSAELHSEIPHACSLPSEAKIDAEPCKTAHNTINTQGAERSSDASLSSACSSKTQARLSPCGYAEKRHTASDADVLETMRVLDQVSVELAARKGQHPSPNRRFRFSLSRMSRSFSFKESSAIPQLNSDYVSAKSGPVMADATSCPENSSREKASCHSRAKSSPIRRILEPLLKSKSTALPRSAEMLPPVRGSLNSSSPKATKVMESSPAKDHGGTNMQALLQVTVKNGFPLFRFVVNNDNSVLAATTSSVTSSGKHESVNYTFYSVDEIKRKGGSWRHQVSKEKNCGYVYNVIGQMKVNSSCFLDATERNLIDKYMVKESVLCGVELRQVEQASPQYIPSSELAAIVVKVPQQSLTLEMLKSEDFAGKGFSESADKCTCNVRENEQQMSITALLPGAIHSLPNKGGPSPLIHRWKSGGSCDCGGWDVGCKLHVLSNENNCCKIPTDSGAFLTSDHLQLFNQSEAPQDKPAFSFAPAEKGMYSVEFSQSISALQAFFISITVISCQKSPELAEIGILSEDNVFQETKNTNDATKKCHSTVETKTSLKYISNPPLSPIGRV